MFGIRYRQKFKSVTELLDLRESQLTGFLRSKDLEVQYSLARYDQQRKIADNETARSRALSSQVSTFSQTETELRSQLNIYVEKFKQESDKFTFSFALPFRRRVTSDSK